MHKSFVVRSDDGQLGAVVVDDVRRSVARTQDLRSNQDDVHQLTKEHEAEGAELEHADRWVAQVETIGSEHSKKDREQQSRFERVAVGPVARDAAAERVVAALEADYPFDGGAVDGGRVVARATGQLLSLGVDVEFVAEVLPGTKLLLTVDRVSTHARYHKSEHSEKLYTVQNSPLLSHAKRGLKLFSQQAPPFGFSFLVTDAEASEDALAISSLASPIA